MQVEQTLQGIGLDRHEIALYVALIRLQNASAGQLSKASGVPRTYAYRILESLIEKGFADTIGSGSIRRYRITDFEAPKRYLESQQFDLYRAQQQAQGLAAQLQQLSEPQVPSAASEVLRNAEGMRDFWQLLHSSITREILVVHPPEWWGDPAHSPEVKKWEQYRQRQHIWERRFLVTDGLKTVPAFTDVKALKAPINTQGSIILVDHYQVQIPSWDPFRALRIESQDIVDLLKQILE